MVVQFCNGVTKVLGFQPLPLHLVYLGRGGYFEKGSKTLDMTSEGLREMLEGDFADMCADKCPLVLMGNRADPHHREQKFHMIFSLIILSRFDFQTKKFKKIKIGPHFFWLEVHTKFWNPTTTPSGILCKG